MSNRTIPLDIDRITRGLCPRCGEALTKEKQCINSYLCAPCYDAVMVQAWKEEIKKAGPTQSTKP